MVGLIHIKDLFHTTGPLPPLPELAREIAHVAETLTVDRLLRRMRAEKLHLAAVVDEYGGVSGIVTLENVIEEIVGPIQDEFDLEVPELVKRGENVYVVSGSMLVDELEQALDVEFSERDEDTVGGVMLSELGGSPSQGDEVVLRAAHPARRRGRRQPHQAGAGDRRAAGREPRLTRPASTPAVGRRRYASPAPV